jgi:DNA polymerase III subunit epsilon
VTSDDNPPPPSGPPQGAPWDSPLKEAALAFVDLEMTGLDALRDRVCEICIERVRNNTVEDRLHTLVRPETGATGNVHVHGIDAAALADAPTFAELVDRIHTLLNGAVFVAHGAQWDVAFIDSEMRRAKTGSPLGSDRTVSFWLDTLNLSRRAFGLQKHSLEALREQFGIDAARAHRADADVHALREVFARCVDALEPTTPRDLWQVRVAERRVREQVLAQCNEAVARGREITLVYRARARAAEAMRMVLTAVDLGLDPPRVIGYQLPGRGRRELRADRILRIETDSEAPNGSQAPTS